MKKTAIAFLVLGLSAAAAIPAFSATLMSESFPYNDGDLTVVSGAAWATHSGTGPDIQVSGGQAFGDHNQGVDDNRPFAQRDGSSKTYACFRATIPAITGSPRTVYFAHLKDATTGFTARVYVVPAEAAFTFALGTSSTPTATWPTTLAYDSPYTVTVSYDAATGVSEMWIDAVNEASAKVTTPPGVTGLLIEAFALRQSNTGVGTAWTFKVDDILVTDAFDETCLASTPAKISTWGRVKSLYR